MVVDESARRRRLVAKQRRALAARYASSSQYLRMVEGLVAEHPGDAFYARQLSNQRDEVARIKKALEYVGGMP